ncbi:MAG: DNA topoisomerase, partial [uncultured bacterium]
YPKTGEKIVADNGRFGPYIKAGVETRSLSPEDNLLSLTVDRAIAMLDTPKVRGRRTTVLKDLGNGIQICNGKYGSYLKSGKVNATIPKELSADTITPEQATAAIEQKRNK